MSELNLPAWSISSLAVKMKNRNHKSVKIIEAKIRVNNPTAAVFKFFGIGHSSFDKGTLNPCMVATFDCETFNLPCMVEQVVHTNGDETDFITIKIEGDYEVLTMSAMADMAFEIKTDAVITGDRQDELPLEESARELKKVLDENNATMEVIKAPVKGGHEEDVYEATRRSHQEEPADGLVTCEKEDEAEQTMDAMEGRR